MQKSSSSVDFGVWGFAPLVFLGCGLIAGLWSTIAAACVALRPAKSSVISTQSLARLKNDLWDETEADILLAILSAVNKQMTENRDWNEERAHHVDLAARVFFVTAGCVVAAIFVQVAFVVVANSL